MAEEVRLPEISENVDSGEVIKVLVKVDDYLEKEQPVVELETEKAAFEVPSPVKGKVLEINVEEGDQVKVGQVILKVDTEATAAEEGRKEKPKKRGEKAAEKKETKEKLSEKKQRQEPAEKTQEEKEERRKQEEQEDRGRETESPSEAEEAREKPKPAEAIPAAPSVRQLGRELGIDIREVAGTAEEARITADDVKEYARNVITGRGARPAETRARALPDFTKWGELEREKITTTRKKIAETLSYTWSNIPQVTQYDQADIGSLEESRKKYQAKTEDHGGKLTITSIALKIVALALKEFPKFNATFDAENSEIIYKKYFHISVAVETDRGLLVPVIRDVDKKSIVQLSVELNDLAQRTRQHKVTPDDMVGGNFTVSNLGGIGGTNFAPIIYWPQVAILGFARATQQPSYKNGRLEPRLILPLSLSYDHRVIDGAVGLRFLRRIVEYLENPFLFAVEENI